MKKTITSEELQDLKNLRSSYEKNVNDLGIYESQIGEYEDLIALLTQEKNKIKDNIRSLRIKEKELAKNLSEKYGNGVIDITTGEISDN